jgi:intraflagellar transport protein 56
VAPKKQEETALNWEEFVNRRDYTGALGILEFEQANGNTDDKTQEWIAYCAFHLGEHQKSLDIYKELLRNPDCDPTFYAYAACCFFYMGMYADSREALSKAPDCGLKTRLMFHLAHKFKEEESLVQFAEMLSGEVEDQLSHAAVNYLRNHFQEATDIYKRLLLENREFLALNVYVAMCYYRLDYYDVSLEILQVYLQHYPDSVTAINLKACNHFRLYNGKAAEAELAVLKDSTSSAYTYDNDLIRHNLVVFRSGEGALKTLPPLVDVIPEARLNLVIYYLRTDEIQQAYNLMAEFEPRSAPEYILKGVVNCSIGQLAGSREHLKMAQQYFQLVGSSASECDTIPGRQCMAQCFFLLRQFEDVLTYLQSIKAYFQTDDAFNHNFGMTLASTGQWKEAEEALMAVREPKERAEYCFQSWLCRVHIMNKKPQLAWDLYQRMETSNESFALLQLIANDCYSTQAWYFSAKAFDVLERLDPNPEYWEGKRGAAIGCFQKVLAGEEPTESLRDVVMMLSQTSNPQVEYIINVMKKAVREFDG